MRSLALMLALLTPVAATAGTQIVGSITPQEARTIVSIAGQVDTLWNARKAAEIAALYAPDATLEMVDRKTGAQGRQDILEYFARSFATLDPAMRHRTGIDRITVLAPDVVVANGHAWLERASGDAAPTPVRFFNTTTVVVRGAEGWRIRMIRTHDAPLEQGLVVASKRTVAGS